MRIGTLAKVAIVAQGGALQDWHFTVERINRIDKRRRRGKGSLNLFEPDLQDFEVYTAPIEAPRKNQPTSHGRMPQRTSKQLCLPYIGHEPSIMWAALYQNSSEKNPMEG